MEFRNVIAKILFGSLAGDGKKRELSEAGCRPCKSGLRRPGVNPLVRNCDGYDEADDRAECGKSQERQRAPVRLARDITEK